MAARVGAERKDFGTIIGWRREGASTLLLAAVVPPKIVQERLAHCQIGIAMDTYGHVMSGMGRDAGCEGGCRLNGCTAAPLAAN